MRVVITVVMPAHDVRVRCGQGLRIRESSGSPCLGVDEVK